MTEHPNTRPNTMAHTAGEPQGRLPRTGPSYGETSWQAEQRRAGRPVFATFDGWDAWASEQEDEAEPS